MFKIRGKKTKLALIKPLVFVLALMAISVITIPQIARSAQKAKQTDCDKNIEAINWAIETYNAENGAYPATLEDVIGTGHAKTAYFPDGEPQCPLGGIYIIDAACRTACSHKFTHQKK
ncbi:MAG: hypothetical protein ACYTFK_07110 [Planctomycetota bacterium]|jgi:competence protein ComGC